MPAAENEMAPRAVGARGWPTADPSEASGITALGVLEPQRQGLWGGGHGPQGGRRALPSFSLPGPGRPGSDGTHLPAGGRGPGLGYGTAKFVVFSGGLSQVHSSVLQLQLGLRRGLRGRERLGPQCAQKRAPGPAVHKTPFLPPRPALPFSTAAPAPWP